MTSAIGCSGGAVAAEACKDPGLYDMLHLQVLYKLAEVGFGVARSDYCCV